MTERIGYLGLGHTRDDTRDHKPDDSSDSASWLDPADNPNIDYSPAQSSQSDAQSLFNGPQPTTDESTNWSGAVLFAGSGESFSTVSAQWVVPTVTQVPLSGVTTTDIAEWVGIDGYNSSDVAQAGVMQVVQTANGGTTISTEAWVEWYPAYAIEIPTSTFTVNAGNTIAVAVETGGAGATTATFILDNETTHQIYETSLTAPAGTTLVGNSAEAIVETPEWINGNQVSQPLLTDFLTEGNDSVPFSFVKATYSNGAAASLSSAQSIGMWTSDVPGSHGSSVQEAYGSIEPSNDSVTVIENDYWGSPTGGTISIVAYPAETIQGVGVGGSHALTDIQPQIIDPSHTTIASATIQITNTNNVAVAGDELLWAGFQQGLSANWNSSTDTLTLSGTASIATYEEALTDITYEDTGTDNSSGSHPLRTVTWTINDGTTTFGTTTTVEIDRLPVVNNVAATDSTGATVTATAATGVLSHDTDLDGDTLTVGGFSYGVLEGQVGDALAGTYGSLTLNANGSYSYVASNTAAINAAPTGSAPTDTFLYEVNDGNDGSVWASLTFTIDRTPIVTASNVVLGAGEATVAVSSLFTASDPFGNAITSYQFVDSGPGEFLLNGVAQPDNQDITIAAAQLSQLTYQGVSGAAPDTLQIRAYDGTAWSNWVSFTVTGPPLTIEASGSTSLIEQGSDYFLNPVAGGTGPEVTMNGAPIGAGQVGGWTAIGAEATANGYEMAWYLPGQNLYTVWNLNSSGNYVSDTLGAVAGNSIALESLEPSFHQDLNGDGIIGVPVPPSTVIEAYGVTSLVESGGDFFMNPVAGGTGPEIEVNGAAATTAMLGGWTPIGAEATATGYEVAWYLASQNLYTVWNTDSSGHEVSDTIGAVAGTSTAFESLETSFHQDLNGDGTIGVPSAAPSPPSGPSTVIESDGATSLVESGGDYFMNPVAGGTGPEIEVNGAAATTAMLGGWTAIGAEATANGYEVAWYLPSQNLYTVWDTDSSGHYVSDTLGAVSGTSTALEALEPSFQQDLNGDGTIGVPSAAPSPPSPPSGPSTVIESDGATSLVESGSDYFMNPVAGGTGPEIEVNGAAATTALLGGWTAIGAEATTNGYEVAWYLASQNLYTVWNTDSNGNYLSDTLGAVSGTSTALEALEPSFHQDLNGDGTIGIPSGPLPPPSTVIESYGVTSLVESGGDYYMNPVAGGTGPALQVNGQDIGVGQAGGWNPIGAEITATGYEVAWYLPSQNLYTVWATDSNGNYLSDTMGAVSGTSVALESLEPSFHQDLNGDGTIGVTAAPNGAVINSDTIVAFATDIPSATLLGVPDNHDTLGTSHS